MEQGRVYLCDEDWESRQFFEKLLSAQGHEVTAFGNGGQMLQALAEAGEERPGLVLLDARLPGAIVAVDYRGCPAARSTAGG